MKHLAHMYAEYSDRNPLPLDSYTPKSSKKVWWKCAYGHEWETRVSVRTEGRGCKSCSRSTTKIGVDDLATTHPVTEDYWDYEMNDRPLNNCVETTSYNAHWVCPRCQQRWRQSIRTFIKDIAHHTAKDCGSRSHARPMHKALRDPLPGESLLDRYPHVALEWDYEKNSVGPETVYPASGKIISWVCSEGHHWDAKVKNRTLNGGGCPYCSGRRVSKSNNLAVTHPHLLAEFSSDNEESFNALTYGSSKKVNWVCKDGHTWTARVNDRTILRYGCPICPRSAPEKELAGFIEELLPEHDVLIGDRKLIKPYEVDIYVPDKKIALEYNGLYWHTDRKLPDDYHQMKYLLCREQGVQLITIWEDQWRDNNPLLKKMLAYKLGVFSGEKIYARKCSIQEISDVKEVKHFMDAYHIQGFVGASIHIALTYDGELVAVGSFLKSEGRNYLVRYATSCSVPGGMSRITSYFKKMDPGELYSFADHCVSTGDLYESNGWVKDKDLKPDYQYVFNRNRYHKFSYRLKRFRNDPALKYHEGATERELAELNNLYRVYDCGKTRYRYVR